MKTKTSIILFICMLIMTCKVDIIYGVEYDKVTPVMNVQGSLSITRAVTTVRKGDFGIIVIQGKANTRYRVNSSFKEGNRTIPVTQWRTTNANGVATFNWFVSEETALGTYPLTITGNGDSLQLSHTVIP